MNEPHHKPGMKHDEMPDWYHVKYRCNVAQDGTRVSGIKWKFGIHEKYHFQAKRDLQMDYWANGEVIISDPITGQTMRVPLDYCEIKPCKRGDSWQTELDLYVEKEYKKAQAKSDKVQGMAPGKMFRILVADGYAYYVITKVNKKTVQYEWRGFGGDAYFDQTLGGGGTIPKEFIEPHIEWAETTKRIFSR